MSTEPNWNHLGPIVTSRVTLPTRKIGVTIAESLRYRRDEDETREQLRHRLEAFVFTQQLASSEHTVTVPYEVPASGWDHFKLAQVDATSPFWRWVARRWPARMEARTASRTVTFSRDAMFPEASIALRDDRLGSPVIFESAAWSEPLSRHPRKGSR